MLCARGYDGDELGRDVRLSGRLEEQPLHERRAVLLARDVRAERDPPLGVVLVREIHDDRVGLPEREVAVVVIDECRNAPVGVQENVRRLLVLQRGEVEVETFVREAELFKY